MRRATLAGVALAGVMAAGCEPGLTSEAPLFKAGGEPPQPGLWALLQPDCTPPQGVELQSWPECAGPVWVGDGSVTMVYGTPMRSTLVVSDGELRIARLTRLNPDTRAVEHSYFALEPEGGAPVRRARVWQLDCLEDDRPVQGVTGCVADTEGAVRRMAETARRNPPTGTAVFIGGG